MVTTAFQYTARGKVAAESFSAGGRPEKLTVAPPGIAAQPIQNIAYLPFGPRIAADFPPLDGGGNGIVFSRREFNPRYQMT